MCKKSFLVLFFAAPFLHHCLALPEDEKQNPGISTPNGISRVTVAAAGPPG